MVVPNPTRDKLLHLMAQRDKLDAKIRVYGQMLEANGNVGMGEPLVDADGFPRNDIDLHQVRQARQQIMCLQNDHKELMKEIEILLHKLHYEEKVEEISNKTAGIQLDETSTSAESSAGTSATSPLTTNVKVNFVCPGSTAEDTSMQLDETSTSAESKAGSSTTSPLSTNMEVNIVSPDSPAEDAGMQLDEPSTSAESTSPLTAIVTVNLVSPGSPAENSGLRLGDQVLEFGSVNCHNFKNLSQIGDVVRNMQDKRITLKIQRDQKILELILIPKLWKGRGLLGCNIVLPDPVED